MINPIITQSWQVKYLAPSCKDYVTTFSGPGAYVRAENYRKWLIEMWGEEDNKMRDAGWIPGEKIQPGEKRPKE